VRRVKISKKCSPATHMLSNLRVPPGRADAALEIALTTHNAPLLQAALASGADPNRDIKVGGSPTSSPLYVAVSQRPPDIVGVKALLSKAADPNRRPGILKHAILGNWMNGEQMGAAWKKSSMLQVAWIVQMLIKHGADIRGEVGDEALNSALDNGNSIAVAALVTAGVMPSEINARIMGPGLIQTLSATNGGLASIDLGGLKAFSSETDELARQDFYKQIHSATGEQGAPERGEEYGDGADGDEGEEEIIGRTRRTNAVDQQAIACRGYHTTQQRVCERKSVREEISAMA